MKKTAEVFISYAWGNKNEKGESREIIVNELYEDLVAKDFKVIRDKVNLSYGGKISDFMKRIGEGKYVVVIISDKYLKSEYCMYEVLEIRKNKAYNDRIFPIILSDANIFDEVNRLGYLDYWSDKREKLEERIRTLKELKDSNNAQEKLKLYDDIREVIGEFTSFIKDVNALTPDMHRDSDFKDLIALIEKKHQQDLSAPSKEEKVITNLRGIDDSKKKGAANPTPSGKKSKSYIKYLIGLLLIPILLYGGYVFTSSSDNGDGGITTSANGPEETTKVPEKTLRIGDQYQGGYIFYKDANGGLICSEELGSHNWLNAKDVCETHRGGGHNDWRRPTKKELKQMYDQKNKIGGFVKKNTGPDANDYWSSGEYGGMGYCINFKYGSESGAPKRKKKRIRAVRTF